MRLSRRRFLTLVAGAALAGGIGLGAAISRLDRPPDAELAATLRELLHDLEPAAAIGAERAAAGVAVAPDHLVQRLAARNVDLTATHRITDLRAALARAIRDDFAAGRIDVIGGWVLAESEADVCMLAHYASR